MLFKNYIQWDLLGHKWTGHRPQEDWKRYKSSGKSTLTPSITFYTSKWLNSEDREPNVILIMGHEYGSILWTLQSLKPSNIWYY